MATTRYFNSDGTVRACAARGPVGGQQTYNLGQWAGCDEWRTTPTSEMQSTLTSTLTSTTKAAAKLAGVKTAPAIDGRSHARP